MEESIYGRDEFWAWGGRENWEVIDGESGAKDDELVCVCVWDQMTEIRTDDEEVRNFGSWLQRQGDA